MVRLFRPLVIITMGASELSEEKEAMNNKSNTYHKEMTIPT